MTKNATIHIAWANIQAGTPEGFKNQVAEEIVTEVPESVRNAWVTTTVPSGEPERPMAHEALERALDQANAARGDTAFGCGPESSMAVQYIYQNNSQTCVYTLPVSFEGSDWTVTDPEDPSLVATLTIQLSVFE